MYIVFDDKENHFQRQVYISLATTGHKTTPSSKGRRKWSFLAGCIPALKRNEDFVTKKGEWVFSRQLAISTTHLEAKNKFRSNIFVLCVFESCDLTNWNTIVKTDRVIM